MYYDPGHSHDHLNLDKLGLKLTKPQHELHRVDLTTFQQAIDWIRGELLAFGYEATEARLFADLATWMFYDVDNNLLIRVPHDLVERVKVALEKRHDAELEQHIERLLKDKPQQSW